MGGGKGGKGGLGVFLFSANRCAWFALFMYVCMYVGGGGGGGGGGSGGWRWRDFCLNVLGLGFSEGFSFFSMSVCMYVPYLTCCIHIYIYT